MWTGNFLKDRRLRPIIAWTKKFPSKKDKSIVFAEKNKTILDHAITVHKSQGSTVDYLQGDLPARKLLEGKIINNLYLGQFYILLSCAKR